MEDSGSGEKKIRVAIVDDHAMVRQMLSNVLSTLKGYHVIAEATSGLEAIKVCQKEKPDLILLDAQIPELNGLEVLKVLLEKLPHARFLIVSGSENEVLPVRFIQAGAHGYVSKMESLQVFTEAIRTVSTGGNFYKSKKKNLLQQAFMNPAGPAVLTPREMQVLQLIAEGSSTKEIASKLEMSVKTAETHRNNLMQKLNIHDVAGLTRYAVGEGIIKVSNL